MNWLIGKVYHNKHRKIMYNWQCLSQYTHAHFGCWLSTWHCILWSTYVIRQAQTRQMQTNRYKTHTTQRNIYPCACCIHFFNINIDKIKKNAIESLRSSACVRPSAILTLDWHLKVFQQLQNDFLLFSHTWSYHYFTQIYN